MVKQFFDGIRAFTQSKSTEKFDLLLNSLVFFLGYKQIRINCLRLLYLTVLNPFWLKVKIQK